MSTKKSAEQVKAEGLLTTWQAHSSLFAVKAIIIGQYRDENGEVREVEMGTVPGSLRQFSTGSFGFNASGKVPDLSPTGSTGKGFQVALNLIAIKSKEWPTP